MPSETEIAWLAGLLEGEGCFLYSKEASGRGRIRVVVRMTDRDVVERAAALMGGPGTVTAFDPRSPGGKRVSEYANPETWQTLYIFRAGSAHAERVMRMVRPYMGERRGAKIDELLAMTNLSHHPKETK